MGCFAYLVPQENHWILKWIIERGRRVGNIYIFSHFPIHANGLYSIFLLTFPFLISLRVILIVIDTWNAVGCLLCFCSPYSPTNLGRNFLPACGCYFSKRPPISVRLCPYTDCSYVYFHFMRLSGCTQYAVDLVRTWDNRGKHNAKINDIREQ